MLASETRSGLADRLELAISLARQVGRQAAAFRSKASAAALQIQLKGAQDFVTIADKQAEFTIRSTLAAAFPGDSFVGEESGGQLDQGPCWVVDPIDGTTNFLRGFDHWGVSLALVSEGVISLGVIYDASCDKVFYAQSGRGAFADGTAIHASSNADPSRAMAMLGHSRRTGIGPYLATIEALHAQGIDYRRMGAAAIGLLRVADGTAELYFERHLNSWDMLAAALIAQQAGAIVRLPTLEHCMARGGPVLAMAPGLSGHLEFLAQQVAADGPQMDWPA